MPVSIWEGMEDTVATIVAVRPRSVLDAGVGFGLWGCLLRQYLDVWAGRIRRDQWTTRIDGVEIDPARIQPHAEYLYDEIVVGDIREVVPIRARDVAYDVILFGDVIEHVPKADGLALLEAAAGLATRVVVARIPLGDGWRREGREEPDHHRAQWYPADLTDQRFAGASAGVRIYSYCGNPYGLVVIAVGRATSDSPQHVVPELGGRLEQFQARLEGWLSRAAE